MELYRELVKDRIRPHHWIRSLDRPSDHDKTLFVIDQDVAPAIAQKVPPWLHGFLRRICATAVSDIYQVRARMAPTRSPQRPHAWPVHMRGQSTCVHVLS